ncbi:hypothetical protein MBAV_003577 [Candidatus Magnetobacterium bavaricum]|uniref:Uncharacterized protein n=1 Tax=Candidatus Magnetobacterium bavaricum TaxID=29290 RepID=A0A0F3GQG7_9BACT|nr:hypothetical protein MBAV_003577 [Candidatus Magnetobacterium bavaricum]
MSCYVGVAQHLFLGLSDALYQAKHLVLVEVDPLLGKPLFDGIGHSQVHVITAQEYVVAHGYAL